MTVKRDNRMKKYLVIVEKGESNYGAYVPDVDGCIALGDTIEETVQLLQEALTSHLELMAEDGDAIPEPASVAAYVEVEIPKPVSRKTA